MIGETRGETPLKFLHPTKILKHVKNYALIRCICSFPNILLALNNEYTYNPPRFNVAICCYPDAKWRGSSRNMNSVIISRSNIVSMISYKVCTCNSVS